MEVLVEWKGGAVAVKRGVVLFLFPLLLSALAQALPREGSFARQVAIEAPRALPLEAALRLAATAAGIDLLVGAIPQAEVRGSIRGPFWQVFETLVTVYGGGQVAYSLVGNTLVVGPRPAEASQGETGGKAPSLRYLGYARGGQGNLAALEVMGRVQLVRVGDQVVAPGGELKVVEITPTRVMVERGGKRFVFYLAGGEE